MNDQLLSHLLNGSEHYGDGATHGDVHVTEVTPSNATLIFQLLTASIITNHGYKNITEWEYEMTPEKEITCLRIWIGRGRSPKRLRALALTSLEKMGAKKCIETLGITA
jgi:hypothetical protein